MASNGKDGDDAMIKKKAFACKLMKRVWVLFPFLLLRVIHFISSFHLAESQSNLGLKSGELHLFATMAMAFLTMVFVSGDWSLRWVAIPQMMDCEFILPSRSLFYFSRSSDSAAPWTCERRVLIFWMWSTLRWVAARAPMPNDFSIFSTDADVVKWYMSLSFWTSASLAVLLAVWTSFMWFRCCWVVFGILWWWLVVVVVF